MNNTFLIRKTGDLGELWCAVAFSEQEVKDYLEKGSYKAPDPDSEEDVASNWKILIGEESEDPENLKGFRLYSNGEFDWITDYITVQKTSLLSEIPSEAEVKAGKVEIEEAERGLAELKKKWGNR